MFFLLKSITQGVCRVFAGSVALRPFVVWATVALCCWPASGLAQAQPSAAPEAQSDPSEVQEQVPDYLLPALSRLGMTPEQWNSLDPEQKDEAFRSIPPPIPSVLPRGVTEEDFLTMMREVRERVIFRISEEGYYIDENEFIYETKKAFDLVREAKAAELEGDRDRAIQLYQQAMAAQPGAKINAKLAARIAEMYAYIGDRERGIRPDPTKAAEWGLRALELTSPDQYLWAQIQGCLGSTRVVSHNFGAGVGAFEQILKLDPNQLQLDNWRAWPDDDSEASRALREKELQLVRQNLVDLQARVAELRTHAQGRLRRQQNPALRRRPPQPRT